MVQLSRKQGRVVLVIHLKHRITVKDFLVLRAENVEPGSDASKKQGSYCGLEGF